MVNNVNSDGNSRVRSRRAPMGVNGFVPAQELFEKIKMRDLSRYTRLREYRNRSAVEEHFEERGASWVALPASVNPYSSILQELPLVVQSLPWLNRRTHGRVMSFLGVGTGDVEMKITEHYMVSAYKSEQLFIEAIDLNSMFLDYFFTGVYQVGESRQPESKRVIYAHGVHGYFQHLEQSSVCVDGKSYVYFLIGNTLSNFPDQQIAAAMFMELLAHGDYLVLGVRQAIDDDYTIELYRDNPWLYKFIGKRMDAVQWGLNEGHTIRAVKKQTGEERFLTRSYTIDQLHRLFSDLSLEKYWLTKENTGAVYKLRRGAILAVFKRCEKQERRN